MKTNKIILAGLMAVGMFFVACTENAPEYQPAQPESNSILAYFAANNASAIEVEPNKTFSVVIGRDNVAEAATFELTYDESVEGAFTVNPTISFATGDSTAVVEVTLNDAVPAGDVATLSLQIPDNASTVYSVNAASDITIAVTAGYLWVSAGTCTYQSGICTAGFGQTMQAEVEVQHASNYLSEAGDKLYRLMSPYYYVSQGILCTQPGIHISFILDKDNNAKELLLKQGENLMFDSNAMSGIQYLYWDTEGGYAAYCAFINQGNTYVIQSPWSSPEGLYGPYQEIFIFTPPTE